MSIYYIIYILIFGVSFFQIKNEVKNKIIFFILFMFAALRYNVGWDYPQYYILGTKFNYLENIDIGNDWVNYYFYLRLEPLNKVLYKITWFFGEPQLIIVLYAIITLVFIKEGIKNIKSNYVVYIWLFYYTFPIFYLLDLNYMRQGVSASIIFYAVKYIPKNKIKYVFWVIIASLFHKTALMMLVLIIINKINVSRIIWTLAFLGSFFSTNLIIWFVKNLESFKYYYIYLKKGVISGGGEKVYYLVIILNVLLIIFYKQVKNNFIKNILLFGCFLYLSLGKLGHIGYRIGMYYLIFILYLIDPIINKIKEKKIILLILNICFLIFLTTILILDTKNLIKQQYIPYKTIFTNYKERLNLN